MKQENEKIINSATPETSSEQNGIETVRRYAMRRSQRNNWLRKYMSVVIPEEESGAPRAGSVQHKASIRRKAKILLAVLITAVAVIAAVPLVKLVANQLTVKNFVISGDCPYTASQLADAAGIKEGDRLFSFDKSDAAGEASRKLTRLRSCGITVKIPDTVVFTVTEEIPVVYTEIAGAYYSLSDTLKVLERSEDCAAFESSGLVLAEIPQTVSAVAGTKLVFSGDTPSAYLTDVINAMNQSGLMESVSKLYLADRFNISAVYSDRYLIKLGSGTGISLKLATASRIIDTVDPSEERQAVIDVSTPSASGLLYVENIDSVLHRD